MNRPVSDRRSELGPCTVPGVVLKIAGPHGSGLKVLCAARIGAKHVCLVACGSRGCGCGSAAGILLEMELEGSLSGSQLSSLGPECCFFFWTQQVNPVQQVCSYLQHVLHA